MMDTGGMYPRPGHSAAGPHGEDKHHSRENRRPPGTKVPDPGQVANVQGWHGVGNGKAVAAQYVVWLAG